VFGPAVQRLSFFLLAALILYAAATGAG